MRTDGSEPKVIATSKKELIDSFTLQGDTLIYYNIISEYKENENGDHPDLVNVKRMDLKTGKTDTLDSLEYVNGRGDWYGSLQMAGDKFCYTLGGGSWNDAYSMDLKALTTASFENILGMTILSLNAGDYLYMATSDDMGASEDYESAIVRSDLHGMKSLVILGSDEAAAYNDVCVAGDWLFYTDMEDNVGMMPMNGDTIPATQAPPSAKTADVSFDYDTSLVVVKGLNGDGRELWEHNWEIKPEDVGQIDPCSQATVKDGEVYLQVNDSMLALDAATGQVTWQSPKVPGGLCQPIVSDDAVYACSYFSGELAGFSRKDGSILFRSSAGEDYTLAYKVAFKGKNILVTYEQGSALFDTKGKLISANP
jgi:hypothetical protein